MRSPRVEVSVRKYTGFLRARSEQLAIEVKNFLWNKECEHSVINLTKTSVRFAKWKQPSLAERTGRRPTEMETYTVLACVVHA